MPDMTNSDSDTVYLNNPYPIPLYLNQKYVFSILAMMEKGLAQIENVKATRSEQEDRSHKVSGEVGLSNVFALLSLKLGGEKSSQKQSGDIEEITSQRVHTPDSLFARLRERLHEENAIRVEDFRSALPGDYIEFAVTLHKNPLIETLETIESFGKMAEAVEDTTSNHHTSGKGSQGRGNPRATHQPAPESSTARLLRQVDVLLKNLRGEEGGTFDLIGEVSEEPLQVVLVLDPNFANDPATADLVDGEYTVLGKVVRVVPEDSSETISLLRKTSLGKAGPIIQQLVSGLASMNESGIRLPKTIETELAGPAIQVVPIAIFM